MEYAQRLLLLRHELDDDLLLVMRVYFEKPRTTIGWKGLINDPSLDESYDIGRGLRTARKLLLDLNNLGMPAGTEYLDLMTPQYLADLISWGAIGARTTESQLHREMASGLSCPVLQKVMIDFSHANSRKVPAQQIQVCADVCRQIEHCSDNIIGAMIESHLIGGRQELTTGHPLTYGQSITDSCLGWEDSADLLKHLAHSASIRRKALNEKNGHMNP